METYRHRHIPLAQNIQSVMPPHTDDDHGHGDAGSLEFFELSVYIEEKEGFFSAAGPPVSQSL